ncbi:C2H2 type zinc-finger-domain-containing protein [Chaetomium strumarium]|uniref:C2H2 type zinc-finger-domain-containing protein n=1 Tax=Chaetomium strumarium TaxID=1170767 RepID=A0AAJ0M4B8_9PEZI|nr:C2H2 type zinc-finger-domain-containing protein [Chaetomium strumarium]
MSDTGDMDATVTAPVPSLECRLCDVSFETVEEKRQHAKSEWHVYKIRCRVAEPGSTLTPPDNLDGISNPSTRQRNQGRKSTSTLPPANKESSDEESETDTSDLDSSDRDIFEFLPEECLFCAQCSNDFVENLSHMHQAHSFMIPFEASLAVDPQTLIWFLHMVINSYRECICCGTHRRSVEAVRQHMLSKGHCRFNVTDEMRGFYDMDALGQHTADGCSHPDDHTLRLPTGKLLAHRSQVDPSPRSRRREKTPAGPSALLASEEPNPTTGEPQALTKRDRKEQALTTQVAQLRAGDRMSLIHLPESQQRSLLAVHKKELDKAKRADRRTRSRLDHVGNKTAVHTKYYQQENPVYQCG